MKATSSKKSVIRIVVASRAELKAIERGREQIRRGEFVTLDEIRDAFARRAKRVRKRRLNRSK